MMIYQHVLLSDDREAVRGSARLLLGQDGSGI